jgi:hypothetical protein
MLSAWKRVLVVALALALPWALLGCGGSEEPDVEEPEAVEPETAEPEDVEPEESEPEPTEPDESEEEAEGTGDISDLEGELEGAHRILDGFPEDIPLPAGRLLQSSSEGWGEGTMYSVEISNASSVSYEDALDWYMERLEEAGFTISKSAVDPGLSQAEVDATDEAGREVSARFGSGDEGLGFSLAVKPPLE